MKDKALIATTLALALCSCSPAVPQNDPKPIPVPSVPAKTAHCSNFNASIQSLAVWCDYMPMFDPGTHGRFNLHSVVDLQNLSSRDISVKTGPITIICPPTNTPVQVTEVILDPNPDSPGNAESPSIKISAGTHKNILLRCRKPLDDSPQSKLLEHTGDKPAFVIFELQSGSETLKLGDSAKIDSSY